MALLASRRVLTLILFFSAFLAPSWTALADDARTIDRWLVLGPAPLPWPAFHGDAEGFALADLLDPEPLDLRDLWPAEGDRRSFYPGQDLAWTAAGGELTAGDGPRVAWLAAYLETPRFRELTLELRSHHLLEAFLDGEEVTEKTASDKADDGETPEPGKVEAKLALTTGKHLLVVKTLYDPEAASPWTLTASWADAPEVRATLEPRHAVRLTDLLDGEEVTALHVAPDGGHVAVELRHPAAPSEDGESRIEIRRLPDGVLVRTLRGGESDFAWVDGGHYSYTTTSGKDDKASGSLWRAALDGGELLRILDGVVELAGYRFSADGRSVVYAVNEPAETDERGVKLYRGATDRWPWARDRLHLYQVTVPDGTRRRLTVGQPFDRFLDLDPAGSRALLARTRYSVTARPFSATELWELDLATLETRRVGPDLGWFGEAVYAPGGEDLLVLGGPSLFGDAGLDVPEGTIANDYDTQAYLLDLASGDVRAITRDYDPTIRDARWGGGELYLRVEDRSWVRLVRWDAATGSFTPVGTELDTIDAWDVARSADAVAWEGSGASEPPRVEARVAGSAPRLLYEPDAERFADVALGEVQDWELDAPSGRRLLGRVYYPPGFDPERRWPLLVYYYGGTSPTERDFGGRYPKELWAARGYVVYVLQPSGATGFGQSFSALHVNDWSKTVAGEIIAGTEAFLAAHPFVDPTRVGCLGASFGGFMTMRLLTLTDLFAAAVAHAGISNIAGYWGEGHWGYLYSGVASAGSFPWNNRELYVDESPIFHADQITTPLLLVHGSADTNVPPGQSQELYTALRILGREVELLEMAGQNHTILAYEPRKVWIESILAWFDRHLKGEPEHWEHLYGTPAEPEG